MKEWQLRDTRKQVKRLHAEGLTQVQIAEQLDVTQQRVSELLKALREAGELAPAGEAK